jgi:hypothetical protein
MISIKILIAHQVRRALLPLLGRRDHIFSPTRTQPYFVGEILGVHAQQNIRCQEREISILHWGPYLSERQWGTVREDYSDNGDAWNFFTHDHARSRAYRWGEDGLGASPTTSSGSASLSLYGTARTPF